MTLSRLLLVVAALVIVINGEETETPTVREDSKLATSDSQRVEKDGNNGERQGRMALHAEAPSSKAKREQALRNILAARRRQLLGSRMSEVSKSSPRTPRPVISVSKDPLDMLEAQETRHGVYVTAPIGDEISVVVSDDEESVILSPQELTKSSSIQDVEPTKSSFLIKTNDTDLSKIDTSKNSSMSRGQKTLEPDIRRKNIVAMPDSLYNHFRPVESNIPVEDMTQFLYFGQKIHPESQNISGNSSNSVIDTSSTSPSVINSRRRYSMKRFSTTTPIPIPRLEEIINEEMNIALERSTIERNKIPKTKNIFRAPGSGAYFRKSVLKPTDPTVFNVILTRESSRNATAMLEDKRENVLLRNSKFHSDSSAHAHQVVADEGSSGESVAETASAAVVVASTHQAGNATGNATDSTQLHKDQTIANKEKRHQRKDSNSIKIDSLSSSSIQEIATIKPTTSNYEKIDDKSNKITTWQTVHSNEETTTFGTKIDFDKVSRIASSTINDLAGTLEPKSSSIIPTAVPSHSSSLRIVVTEPMIYESGIESVREAEEEDEEEEEEEEEEDDEEETLEDAEKEVDDTVANLQTGNSSSPSSLTGNIFSSTDTPIESTLRSSIVNKKSNASETKQQHVYAYEITNVTRLLRNYTGSDLNVVVEELQDEKKNKTIKKIEEEEQTVRSKEDSTLRTNVESIKEIRNVGSGEPTPQPLPLLLPTLQRSSGSGGIVEPAARTPGELSAGTDVGEATATSTNNFNTSTGGTPIITSASSSSSSSSRISSSSNTSVSGTNSNIKISNSSSQTPSSSSASSSSSSHLVGERGRKGAVSTRQHYHHQNQNRGSGGIGIGSRNTWPSSSTPVTTTEVSGASTAGVDRYSIPLSKKDRKNIDEVTENIVSTSTRRWNHTGINKIGIGNDRSESFGNDRRYMRKSVSQINQKAIEDGLIKEFKRRRQSSLFSHSVNNWRKNLKIGMNERTMENRTENSENFRDNRTSPSIDDVGFDKFNNTSSETMMEIEVESTVSSLESVNQTTTTIIMEKVMEDITGTTISTPTTLDSPSTRLEVSNDQTEKVQSAKSFEASASEYSIGDEETNKSIEITKPAPAFPVTPRMLIDQNKSVNEESIGNETNKTQEASRPFGLAEDLDPSEIQKMYRSQTIKPEIMTTIPEKSSDFPMTTLKTMETSMINSDNSTITRTGNERSPEVRGRNLSDKNKDDDILPIMQLYNTSDIFNGTGNDDEDAASTTLKTLVLPGAIEVNTTKQENDEELMRSTTFEPETSESLAKERKGEERQTGQMNQDDNPAGIIKKNRQSGKEEIDSIGSKLSNNSYSNGTQNRTRYRPTYYHPTPPEFIGYRPEFNGSFFEPGMISVSPRESINISEVITKRHNGDNIATQETVAVVAYILATLVVFPIAVGVGLILRRLIIRNRKVLEESDTSSEISCRKDALNLENGDFKTSIEKAITKLPRIQHLCHEAEKPPPPPSQESRWEFPRDKLRLQTVLGQGNFGQVWKAEADDLTGHQGTTRLVAVKTVKEGASAREKEDLVRELEIMQQLGNHPNVVTLLGCCTDEEPHYLILEYVMYGKLLAYLRDHRTRQDFYNFSEDSAALTSRDLTVFGYCVARGMEYLASKKIIHRDLAARNVLVDHNKLCKIADFGMSRFANEDGEVIEARHGRNALPIRWMAPESLIYSLFTTKTDVWSFGILMWEIVTLGSTPYPDMAAREVMRNVQNGYRLERPSHCRSELFRVIARCWQADPDRRPEFQTLRRDMAQLLEDSMNGHYVDLESFASECTD